MTASVDVPTTDHDFQAADFVLDPYPGLSEIQRLGPVVWHTGTDQYLITRYQDCALILADAAGFASEKDFFIRLFGGETMECMEHERHSKVRGIWAKDFRRPSLRTHNAVIVDIVDGEIQRFVSKLRDGGRADAMADMIRPIPTLVIAELMGIPRADYAQFAHWSDDMALMGEARADPTPRGQELVRRGLQATADLNGYIAERIEACPHTGGDDLISRMVNSPVAASEMTHQEIVASNSQLVFAGNESTGKLFGQVMLALAQHPEQRELLRNDRSLIPNALEEIHRWNSVVHCAWRTLQSDQEVAGTTLPSGSTVLCLQGIANRDADRWDEPDRLDVTRPLRSHLGFGFGMHMCLGIHLARIEAEIWLNHLLDELPEWTVTDVDWGTDWVLRGPVRLDVSLP